MNTHKICFAVSLLLVAGSVAGCGASNADKLRDALGRSNLSLRDSVAVAEKEHSGAEAFKGHFVAQDAPEFRIDSAESDESDATSDRIDAASGKVVQTSRASAPAGACADQVPLADAIAEAEDEVPGQAIAVQPDDDDACNREVKVLGDDDIVWEVKLDPQGEVLEKEHDDEEGESEIGEDDD